jgi:hypothetical protein
MWARIARFDGDPKTIEERLERLNTMIEGRDFPSELSGARLMLLVDRESGGMLGLTLFETEEAMRKGDEAMNRGAGRAGARSAVEFYEVPIDASI